MLVKHFLSCTYSNLILIKWHHQMIYFTSEHYICVFCMRRNSIVLSDWISSPERNSNINSATEKKQRRRTRTCSNEIKNAQKSFVQFRSHCFNIERRWVNNVSFNDNFLRILLLAIPKLILRWHFEMRKLNLQLKTMWLHHYFIAQNCTTRGK